MPSTRITVKAKREIARGSERQVYKVKGAPDMLLKVMRSKHLRKIAETDDKSFSNWLMIRQAYGVFRREQRAWTDAMLRAAVRSALPPLAGIGDFVLTQDGLGQLVERVRDTDGNTAPTLHDLTHDIALDPDKLEKLNEMVAAFYDWHIPAYDLGPKNILWQQSQARFVVVDGFGDRAAIPLVTWFRKLNNWKLDQTFAETAQKCPLIWNKDNRRFEAPDE